MTERRRGRPRDTEIEDAVLDAALEIAAREGFAELSFTAIAAHAGTTRPALYRRWGGKTALMVDAVARLARTDYPQPTGHPYEDLIAELEHFRHCITLAGALPLAGIMLSERVDQEVRSAYLENIVRPRRSRLRGFLHDARDQGLLDADADLDVAGSFLTGSWYAFALADVTPPDDWAERTAQLIWRACGGSGFSALANDRH